MKKIFIVCLTLVMLVSMSLSVCAEVGGFIESPSNNQAPQLIEGTNVSEDCVAQLIISAYADRDDLPEDIREKLEEAYKIIRENPDLSALNEDLIELAANIGISVTDLAVSDMFDISATDCESHEDHGHFDITLKSDTLKNFVCLLHYYNGEWRIVDNAEVTNNGTHLEFDEDEFSPFAIVVSTAPIQSGVSQACSNCPILLAIIAALSLILLILLLLLLLLARKNKKNDK